MSGCSKRTKSDTLKKMFKNKNPKVLYNRYAKFYESVLKLLRYHSTLKTFLKSLPLKIESHAPKILDLGCGTGMITDILKEKFPNSQITGFDYSEAMLIIHKQRYPDVPLIIGNYNDESSFHTFPDYKSVSLASLEFDLVLSAGSVSEYGNPQKTIPFIYRILKQEGIFLNIGVSRNLYGYISGWIWDFKPLGEKRCVEQCWKQGFTDIAKYPISWKLFPMNIFKYALMAIK